MDLNDQRSFALRLIVHYVGDIHQPLHTTSQFSKKYSKGDRGGNFQKLDKKWHGVANLHFLWDSVIYKYVHGPGKLPLKDKDWNWLKYEVDKLALKYPIKAELLHEGDFKLWASEGFKLARTFVYPGFTEKEKPSEEYKRKALKVVEN